MMPAYYATRCGRFIAHVVFHERIADLLTVEEAEQSLARHKHAAGLALQDHQSLTYRNNAMCAGDLTAALRTVKNLKLQRAA